MYSQEHTLTHGHNRNQITNHICTYMNFHFLLLSLTQHTTDGRLRFPCGHSLSIAYTKRCRNALCLYSYIYSVKQFQTEYYLYGVAFKSKGGKRSSPPSVYVPREIKYAAIEPVGNNPCGEYAYWI